MKHHIEYRLNKKGAECFRTISEETVIGKFKELSAKRPNVYTMQRRYVQLDRYGVELHDLSGRPLWSCWA